MKGLFLVVAAKTTRDKAPYSEERAVCAVSTEKIKEWKRSELGEKRGQLERNELSRLAECLCGCGCVGVIGWARRAVCGWVSLDFCSRVCVCVCVCVIVWVNVGVIAWVRKYVGGTGLISASNFVHVCVCRGSGGRGGEGVCGWV